MPNLSLRGLDAHILARIKTDARRRKTSVNRTIIEALNRHFGPAEQTYDDLDALAGKWTKRQAGEFDAAVAPFGEVDTALWVAEPRPAYQVKATAPKKRPPSRK